MNLPFLIILFEIGRINCGDPENVTETNQTLPGAHSHPVTNLNLDLDDTQNLSLDILSTLQPNTDKIKNETQHTCTITFTPKHQYNFTEVTEGSNTIWSANTQMQFSKKVNLVQKKGLTQLVEVKNDSKQLYFKREKSKFVPVNTKQEYMRLQESLERINEYLDKWVELDLSKSVPNTQFFSTQLVYEDGVPIMEVKTLSPFDLYKVYDSEGKANLPTGKYEPKTLWVYDDRKKVRSLIMYQFNKEALLNLTLVELTTSTPSLENKVFKMEENTWVLIDKDNLLKKFKEFKSRVNNVEIELDVEVRKNLDEKFYKKTVVKGYNSELMLYPVMGYHLKKLLCKGTETSVLTNNQRFSAVKLYLYKHQIHLIAAVVWENDEEKNTLYFMNTDKGLVSIDQTKFRLELFKFRSNEDENEYDNYYVSEDDDEEEEMSEEQLKKEEMRLSSLKNVKFNVNYYIDEKYFRQEKREEVEWEVHSVFPKQNFMVNLVDSKQGVVWKSKEPGLHARSMELYFKGEKVHSLKIYVVGRRTNTYKYYKMSNNKWKSITLEHFYRELNKHDLLQSMFH